MNMQSAGSPQLRRDWSDGVAEWGQELLLELGTSPSWALQTPVNLSCFVQSHWKFSSLGWNNAESHQVIAKEHLS